jgi:hypothetical protein
VHELAGANPSKMLLAAIQRMPSKPDKDDEFFLGVLRAGRLEALYHIMSGDPSRGTMALEADSAPAAGETVQVRLVEPGRTLGRRAHGVARSSISHGTSMPRSLPTRTSTPSALPECR